MHGQYLQFEDGPVQPEQSEPDADVSQQANASSRAKTSFSRINASFNIAVLFSILASLVTNGGLALNLSNVNFLPPAVAIVFFGFQSVSTSLLAGLSARTLLRQKNSKPSSLVVIYLLWVVSLFSAFPRLLFQVLALIGLLSPSLARAIALDLTTVLASFAVLGLLAATKKLPKYTGVTKNMVFSYTIGVTFFLMVNYASRLGLVLSPLLQRFSITGNVFATSQILSVACDALPGLFVVCLGLMLVFLVTRQAYCLTLALAVLMLEVLATSLFGFMLLSLYQLAAVAFVYLAFQFVILLLLAFLGTRGLDENALSAWAENGLLGPGQASPAFDAGPTGPAGLEASAPISPSDDKEPLFGRIARFFQSAPQDQLIDDNYLLVPAPAKSTVLVEACALVMVELGLIMPILINPWPWQLEPTLLLSFLLLLALLVIRFIGFLRPVLSRYLQVFFRANELIVLAFAFFNVVRIGALAINGGHAASLLYTDVFSPEIFESRLPFISDMLFKQLPAVDLIMVCAIILSGLLLSYLAIRQREQSNAFFDIAFASTATLLIVSGAHCLTVVFYSVILNITMMIAGCYFILYGSNRGIRTVWLYGLVVFAVSLVTLFV
ncbi:MAG: hypothetical protein FWH40_03210 [Coriobacteriia bacterium]|nr:hypothetical protein [Coriobacteriia bacterium]